MSNEAGGNGGGAAETSPQAPRAPKPAGPLHVGDRVVRLSWPDKKPVYEATVAEVVIVHDRGERKKLYRLDREDGEPSPIKVRANALRRIE